MNKAISLATVRKEIEDAMEYGEIYGWQINSASLDTGKFTVLIQSPVDQEKYLLEFVFDDYPEKPFLINFIHPETGAVNGLGCLPKGNDSFFNTHALTICHPCSRGAYAGYKNLHTEWPMIGWQKIAGGLINVKFILMGIYERIADKNLYDGRLK
jgi:hypothetical protein